jgi:hypothetical protein
MTSLKNIEEDEAGRLRAFRQKFGRGWDAENTVDENEDRDHATYAYYSSFLQPPIWPFGLLENCVLIRVL